MVFICLYLANVQNYSIWFDLNMESSSVNKL